MTHILNRSSILSIESDYIECSRQLFIYLNENIINNLIQFYTLNEIYVYFTPIQLTDGYFLSFKLLIKEII